MPLTKKPVIAQTALAVRLTNTFAPCFPSTLSCFTPDFL